MDLFNSSSCLKIDRIDYIRFKPKFKVGITIMKYTVEDKLEAILIFVN